MWKWSHPGCSVRWAIFLTLMLADFGHVQAQQGPSPLTGKTVHLYNPFQDLLPLIDLSGTGYSMTEEGPNWYRFDFDSIGGGLQPWFNSFQFRTEDWKLFGPAGFSQTNVFFKDSVFGAGREIWIMADPAGPADAAPLILTKPPGTVHLFNSLPANRKFRNPVRFGFQDGVLSVLSEGRPASTFTGRRGHGN